MGGGEGGGGASITYSILIVYVLIEYLQMQYNSNDVM